MLELKDVTGKILPAPEEQELEKMTKQIYSLFYIHDTEACGFLWTVSTLVACHCWLAESPLAEPVNSMGCHQSQKPPGPSCQQPAEGENSPWVQKLQNAPATFCQYNRHQEIYFCSQL